MTDEIPSFEDMLKNPKINKAVGRGQTDITSYDGVDDKVSFPESRGNKTKSGITQAGSLNNTKWVSDDKVHHIDGVMSAQKKGGNVPLVMVDEGPIDADASLYSFAPDDPNVGNRGKFVRKITPREQLRIHGVSEPDIDKLISSGMAKTNIRDVVGDAIPISMMEDVFRNILENKFDVPLEIRGGLPPVYRYKEGGEPLKLTELFAGMGSQAQALRRLGVPFKSNISEIDDVKIKAYNTINGQTNNLGDITQMQHLPDTDILTYTAPCTNLSSTGKREGMAEGSGTASSLIWYVGRLLEDAKRRGTLPPVLVMENVKGIMDSKNIDDLNEWIRRLNNLGYTSSFKVINAKDHGVPQNRERFIMVSRLGGGKFIFPPNRKTGRKISDILEKGITSSYYYPRTKLSNFDTYRRE